MFKFFLRRLLNKYAALIVSQKHFLPENQGLTVVSIYFEKLSFETDYSLKESPENSEISSMSISDIFPCC